MFNDTKRNTRRSIQRHCHNYHSFVFGSRGINFVGRIWHIDVSVNLWKQIDLMVTSTAGSQTLNLLFLRQTFRTITPFLQNRSELFWLQLERRWTLHFVRSLQVRSTTFKITWFSAGWPLPLILCSNLEMAAMAFSWLQKLDAMLC